MTLAKYLEQVGRKEEAVAMMKEKLAIERDTTLEAHYLGYLVDVDFKAAVAT